MAQDFSWIPATLILVGLVLLLIGLAGIRQAARSRRWTIWILTTSSDRDEAETPDDGRPVRDRCHRPGG